VKRGFRYRFYPTAEQETLLRRTIGCVRLVYNKALHAKSEAWTSGKKSLGYAAQSSLLTSWKKEPDLAFLREVSSVPLQQGLRHLQVAYTNFFARRARYPRFKKKHRGGSAEFTRSAFTFDGTDLRLAKMAAPLDVRWSRPLPRNARPSSVTVSVDPTGRWHVSILCEDKTVKALPKLDGAVGIDLGVSALATLSGGEKIPNGRFDQYEMKRKKILSRRFNKTEKGTKNRQKARLKLARLHARVADRRRDYLHKLSARLVRENQTIVVEDLNIAGMLKNHCLARVISDASMSMLLSLLAYKCEWYGRDLVKIDRFFPSSKTCSHCGLVVESLPLSVRHWTCPGCGAEHDRDVNAARNILAAGLAVAREGEAWGPGVSHRILRSLVQLGMKQEPGS
jgi:putative transposase